MALKCVLLHSPSPGVAVLTVRELFEFAVDPLITEDTLDAALDRLMEIATRCGSGCDACIKATYHLFVTRLQQLQTSHFHFLAFSLLRFTAFTT